MMGGCEGVVIIPAMGYGRPGARRDAQLAAVVSPPPTTRLEHVSGGEIGEIGEIGEMR